MSENWYEKHAGEARGHEHVIEMMQDFLAHDALVTRLTKGQ